MNTDEAVRDQAERAVLGAIMVSPDAAEAITDTGLHSSDFAHPHHGITYAYLVAAYAAGEPTDPLSLSKRLLDDGQIRGELTASFLVDCQRAAEPGAAVRHAGIVAEEAHRRRIIEAGRRLARIGEVTDPDKRDQLVTETLAELQPGARRAETNSWAAVDLGPWIRGEVETPRPAVGLHRSDGLQTIYPGKEHAVIGEMEAGKSWWALACAVAEMNAGRTVIYMHFEESDPGDTVVRLRALGATVGDITNRFRWVAPSQKVTEQRIAPLLAEQPSLVVLDGVNEAMALHGWGIREEDGAASFRQHLVRPFLDAGAATLACDHVVKDREARGRYGLGSIHKGNGLSGSLILLETADPFGRGLRGRSHVYVTKDRPGHLRAHGEATKLPGKTFLGELVVDDSQERSPELTLKWWAPKPDSRQEMLKEDQERDQQMEAFEAVFELAARGQEATSTTVAALIRKRKQDVADRLARLLVDGWVVMQRQGQRQVYYPLKAEGVTHVSQLPGWDRLPDSVKEQIPAPDPGTASQDPTASGDPVPAVPCSGSKDPGTAEQAAGHSAVPGNGGNSPEQREQLDEKCTCGIALDNRRSRSLGKCFRCQRAEEAA